MFRRWVRRRLDARTLVNVRNFAKSRLISLPSLFEQNKELPLELDLGKR
jgi:hypothetical protein